MQFCGGKGQSLPLSLLSSSVIYVQTRSLSVITAKTMRPNANKAKSIRTMTDCFSVRSVREQENDPK